VTILPPRRLMVPDGLRGGAAAAAASACSI